MAKILIFPTNTDRKIAVVPPSERMNSTMFDFARPRRIVVNSDRGAAALSFPEAWWPFVVRPSAKFTNS